MFRVPALRVNAAILLVAPFLTIGAIKATNLIVPDRYYFSISKALNKSDDPFVMLQPTASGKKLCEVFTKYGIDTSNTSEQCQLNDKASATESNAASLSPTSKDIIYRYAFQADPKALEIMNRSLSSALGPPDEAVLRTAVESWHTHPEDKLKAIAKRYVDQMLGPQSVTALQQLYVPLRSQLSAQRDREDGTKGSSTTRPTSANEPQRARSAQTIEIAVRAAARLEPRQLQPPMSITTMVIEAQQGYTNWPGFLKDYYRKQLTDQVFRHISAEVANSQGLEPTRASINQHVAMEIAVFNIKDYLISIAIRIMPVVLIAAFLGFALGWGERYSIALAAAFGALLLCWPIFFLWDGVVGYQWKDARTLFGVFYGAYIAAFFITALWGAQLGAWLADKIGIRGRNTAGSSATANALSGRDIVYGAVTTVVANAMVVIFNMGLPVLAR